MEVSRFKNLIEEKLGLDCEVKTVTKNNSEKIGVMIKSGNICPTYYPEDMGDDEEKVLADVKYQLDHIPQFNTGIFDTAPETIKVRLFGKEGNEDLLKDLVSRDFLNMAVVPYMEVAGGIVNITKALLKTWDIDEDELFSRVCGVEYVFSDMFSYLTGEFNCEFKEVPEEPMFLLVGKDRTPLAASVITEEEVLKKVHDKVGDFYILPSSVHEVIIVPAKMGTAEDLKAMVEDVNSTVLDPLDKLTDSVYIFKGESLEIAA